MRDELDDPEEEDPSITGDDLYVRETFGEFMALTQYNFDEPPRKLTRHEKLEIWERMRRDEAELGGRSTCPTTKCATFNLFAAVYPKAGPGEVSRTCSA